MLVRRLDAADAAFQACGSDRGRASEPFGDRRGDVPVTLSRACANVRGNDVADDGATVLV
jgi:hypothetical protein